MIIIKFSRFTHKFDGKESKCLFNSLLLNKVYLDNEEWASIEKYYISREEIEKPSQLIHELYEQGFIVNEGEDEKLYQRAKKVLRKPKLTTMFLIISENCNYACKYCFEEQYASKNHSTKNMSIDVAKKALETFAKDSNKNSERKEIFFYGGEPLMNKEVLYFSLDHIKKLHENGQLSKHYVLNINTNASLIDDKFIEKAKDSNLHFSVSLDGFEEMHNQYRIFRDGKGTFDATMKGIEKLKKADMSFGISCTVGKHNIDKLEEVTEWFATDLGCKAIGFNILLPDYSGANIADVPMKKITEKILNSFEVARKYGVYEERTARQLRSFIDEELYPYDCAGCGRQIVVTPDKMIGPCLGFMKSRQYYLKSNLESFDISKIEIFNKWLERTPLNKEECKDCNVLGICGAGCHYNAYGRAGSIDNIDKDYCSFVKDTIDWFIKDLEEKITNRASLQS